MGYMKDALIKGVVLAGGTGSRLWPLTKVTNKHLLPVYDKPMIYYPLECLVKAGIREVLLVTGGNDAGSFLRLLGNGKELGLKSLEYTYQDQPGGIAQALALAEDFADAEPIVLLLGDNIFQKSIAPAVRNFAKQGPGARILLKALDNPQAYGVAELNGDRVVGIEEKPAQPKSNLVVVGIYMYDRQVFDVVRTLKPSTRGELEITDVNNWYIHRGLMNSQLLDGWWADAGENIDFYLASCNLVARDGANLD